MTSKKLQIKCLQCNRTNTAIVTEIEQNRWSIDLNYYHQQDPSNIAIISGRFRKDMDFGWECVCGNDSRLAREEFPDIKKLVINGGESSIKKITKSLSKTDKQKFLVTTVT